jgi:hypothetical protein
MRSATTDQEKMKKHFYANYVVEAAEIHLVNEGWNYCRF